MLRDAASSHRAPLLYRQDSLLASQKRRGPVPVTVPGHHCDKQSCIQDGSVDAGQFSQLLCGGPDEQSSRHQRSKADFKMPSSLLLAVPLSPRAQPPTYASALPRTPLRELPCALPSPLVCGPEPQDLQSRDGGSHCNVPQRRNA